MERQEFEDNLKKAFENAEANPRDEVWNNIELDLSRSETAVMRRRLAFYKMLAAASVAFALSVIGMNLYFVRDNARLSSSLHQIAAQQQNNGEKSSIEPSDEHDKSPSKDLSSATTIQPAMPDRQRVRSSEMRAQNQETRISSKDVSHHSGDLRNLVAIIPGKEEEVSGVLAPSEAALASLRPPHKSAFRMPEREISSDDAVASMLARLQKREIELTQSKEEKQAGGGSEDLWTSIGFAAGPFSPVTSGSLPSAGAASQSSTSYMARNTIAGREARASGIAYSMGVNMGTRISSRWVVQGGVNYLAQSSEYTAHAAIGSADFQSFRPASINELEKLNSGDAAAAARVVTTAPYVVNNNVSYLSVPLQAGYLILNKKFGVQLNAGVATDLFLHNSKSVDAATIDEISQGRGDDSPYRPVNFSGLVGTELTYRFSNRYRLALNPGVRYPFNSVYKSDIGIQSTPLTFDLGLRFRYIFH